MHFPSHEQKQAILAQVLLIADQRLDSARASEARAFIAQYYDQVDAEDLAARTPEDLYGAAMTHLAFAREFASGTPKLAVYNPRAEEHGWASPHTVIEMVNDDMPFLVDSVTMEVNRQGYTLHLLNHPLFSTKRDRGGRLAAFGPPGAEGKPESLIHVEVDREIEPARLRQLTEGILAVLGDVRAAWTDWQAMRSKMDALVAELDTPPPFLPGGEAGEVRAFLAWASDHHFTFLGFRDYVHTYQVLVDQLQDEPGIVF
jgi:glutamate dehydrogenase